MNQTSTMTLTNAGVLIGMAPAVCACSLGGLVGHEYGGT